MNRLASRHLPFMVAAALLAVFLLSGGPVSATGQAAGAQALDIVLVSSPAEYAGAGSLERASDGRLWVLYAEGYDGLVTRTSTDNGTTWSPPEIFRTGRRVGNPRIYEVAPGKLWQIFESDFEGNTDIFGRRSDDGGLTWMSLTRLTDDATPDNDASMLAAKDGKLWLVWSAGGYESAEVRARTSTDGGLTWSPPVNLPASWYPAAPKLAQDATGLLWLVWRDGLDAILARTSADGGVTWSAQSVIDSGGFFELNDFIAGSDGSLWLSGGPAWGEVSLRRRVPGGDWGPWQPFTRAVASDSRADLAALADGKVGLAWYSSRLDSGPSVWFGIPGVRDDLNPPPYVEHPRHSPTPHPDSDDPITFVADVRDETGVASARLVWTRNGAAQPDLAMYDDGTHGDPVPGNGQYTVQIAPLPAGEAITYKVRATDTSGNTFLSPSGGWFIVQKPFAKTADILLVMDSQGNSTDALQPFYTAALAAGGYAYDLWDSRWRGAPGSAILDLYQSGIVIWAVPEWGDLWNPPELRAALERHLDNGGAMFFTGQNIANYASTDFTRDYLHATFQRPDTGIFALQGAAGDPLGDGLSLVLQGSSSANNQFSKDEVAPIAPAAAVLSYQGDGVAGLRVQTAQHKLVFFAFGFEGIDGAGPRAQTMERVLAWLRGVTPRPALLEPEPGRALVPGAVRFSWAGVPGAGAYRIQIDRSPSFDTASLIEQALGETTWSRDFPTPGETWYWRAAATVNGIDGAYTAPAAFRIAEAVVRVSSGEYVNSPALVRAGDGKLWTFYARDWWRGLGMQSSSDGGRTWSAVADFVTESGAQDPAAAASPSGDLWVAFQRNQEGSDIWIRRSTNGGASWAEPTPAVVNPGSDMQPALLRTGDGLLWLAWSGYRDGAFPILYKTSSDGGTTWSEEKQLAGGATGTGEVQLTPPLSPSPLAMAQVPGGAVMVMWYSNAALRYRTTSDGGATWSGEAVAVPNQYGWPQSIALSLDQANTLWLAYDRDNDVVYRKSNDGGATWTEAERFTRYLGYDGPAALAALPDGGMGIAWRSNRGTGNPAYIWYGAPGRFDDVNPPPVVNYVEVIPRNPAAGDPFVFSVEVRDELPGLTAELVWSVDGVSQPVVAMNDGGTDGDPTAGDGRFSARVGPLAEGAQVRYNVRATDADGNVVDAWTEPGTLTIIPAFVKTAGILLVLDDPYGDVEQYRRLYEDALRRLGYPYDLWQAGLRGPVPQSVFDAYQDGLLIWATPWSGYLTNAGDSPAASQLRGYLDAGGRLFLSGQNVASTLGREYQPDPLVADYLHVRLRQDNVGLHALLGAAGDPVGDGLALQIAGGDGAENQNSPDEVDPIAPAQAFLTYTAAGPAAEHGAGPLGSIGTGTGGVRVAQHDYRIVFLSFGFEGISRAADRALLLERSIAWLQGRLPLPLLIAPVSAAPVEKGSVTFKWTSVPGAAGYELQIDRVPAFDSPALITVNSATSQATRTLTAAGEYFWRVRGLPGGSYSSTGQFNLTGPLAQLTNSPAGEGYPALARGPDGKLWVAWAGPTAGGSNVWLKWSADDGETWSGPKLVAGSAAAHEYQPALTVTPGGTLVAAWTSATNMHVVEVSHSGDGGATWSPRVRVSYASDFAANPSLTTGPDGKVWLMYEERSGSDSRSVYRSSTDAGATWSQQRQLPQPAPGADAAILATADGKLLVAFPANLYPYRIMLMSSPDGGLNWSSRLLEGAPPDTPYFYPLGPALAQAPGGEISLALHAFAGGSGYSYYARNAQVYVTGSTDGGQTWSPYAATTRFRGHDMNPAIAYTAGGRLVTAWEADRAGNPDVWLGVQGLRGDTNPPPHVDEAVHVPAPNPEAGQEVTIRALLADEGAVTSGTLVWTRDGASQPDLPMVDDGQHGDYAAADGWYAAQLGPFPAGTFIDYRIRVTDDSGNAVTADPLWQRYPTSFTVQPVFVRTADTLFVLDDMGGANSHISPYFTRSLEATGTPYDRWLTGLRGAPSAALLQSYKVVIWAMPYAGYATDSVEGDQTQVNLRAYLDNGGRLFITGQDLGGVSYTPFYHDYLHAELRNPSITLRRAAGIDGDIISDGLPLDLQGGDGAGTPSSPDEFTALAPAQIVYRYEWAPVSPEEEPQAAAVSGAPLEAAGVAWREDRPVDLRLPPLPPPGDGDSGGDGSPAPAEAGSALRVDTGVYKVVYFGFGFEAINAAGDRDAVMERVLAWLNGRAPRPALVSPAAGARAAPGTVTFQWKGVPGGGSYEFQLATTPDFAAPLVSEAVAGTTREAGLPEMGAYYWRVRALPDGQYTSPRRLDAGWLTCLPLVRR